MNNKPKIKQSLATLLSALLVLGVVALAVAGPGATRASAATEPIVSSATVTNSATSITLPSGSQTYLFGGATGGANTATAFTIGSYETVTNANGYITAALASSTSPTDSYSATTNTKNIGAVAVSGYQAMSESYAASGTAGTTGVSDPFSVSTSGTVAVVIGLVGGEGCVSLSGISGLATLATDTGESSAAAIAIADATLSTGSYTAIETTAACGTTSASTNGALLGVFLFTPTPSSSTSTVTVTVTSSTTITSTSTTTVTTSGSGGSSSYEVLTNAPAGGISYATCSSGCPDGNGVWVASVAGWNTISINIQIGSGEDTILNPIAVEWANTLAGPYFLAGNCAGAAYSGLSISAGLSGGIGSISATSNPPPSYAPQTCVGALGQTGGVFTTTIQAQFVAVFDAGPGATISMYLQNN